jgi:hypothetical protein
MQNPIYFEFVNESNGSCQIGGYPQIELLSKSGVVLPFTYSHRGDEEVTARRPSPVTLRPHATAYALANEQSCTLFTNTRATQARLSLPGATSATVVSILSAPFIAVCPPKDPSLAPIAVSPIEATLRGTFDQH